VWVSIPLVPVIVNVKAPVGELLLMLTFIVLLPEPPVIVAFGLNVALAPVGKPLTLKVTSPAKPPAGVDVTV